MFVQETKLRIRYAETDRMGYVYYGRYAELFEVGRVEALRNVGFRYRDLEDAGVMLPVRDLRITYHKPARYDDELTIRTTITALPSVRIDFAYEVIDHDGTLLTDGSTTLIFVDGSTMRPRRAPEELVKALAPYFA
ncbi:MAG: acyl-CoA thioesterase [Flavobacteriales bacterium]|nr:acyl-CoA thioesterase [Flavobacteriales bacterium]